MKLVLLLLFCSLSITGAYGQNSITVRIDIGRKKAVSNVEVEGVFPNGDTTLKNFISKRLSTLTFKRAKKGSYIVRARYVLSKNADITDVLCEADPGYGMGEEVVRLLRKSPKWEPGPATVRPYRTSSTVKAPGLSPNP